MHSIQFRVLGNEAELSDKWVTVYTNLCSVSSQKTWIFSSTFVRTSDLGR